MLATSPTPVETAKRVVTTSTPDTGATPTRDVTTIHHTSRGLYPPRPGRRGPGAIGLSRCRDQIAAKVHLAPEPRRGRSCFSRQPPLAAWRTVENHWTGDRAVSRTLRLPCSAVFASLTFVAHACASAIRSSTFVARKQSWCLRYVSIGILAGEIADPGHDRRPSNLNSQVSNDNAAL